MKWVRKFPPPYCNAGVERDRLEFWVHSGWQGGCGAATRAAACLWHGQSRDANDRCRTVLTHPLSEGRRTEQAARHLHACLAAFHLHASLPACLPACQPTLRLPCLQFGDNAKYISLYVTAPMLYSEIGQQQIVAYADGKCPRAASPLGCCAWPRSSRCLRSWGCCGRAPAGLPAQLLSFYRP